MKNDMDLEYLDFHYGNKKSPYIIFCHGYGATAQDLSFFHTLKLLKPCNWIFPNAPLKLEEQSLLGGRAWFPLKRDSQNQRLIATSSCVFFIEKHIQKLLNLIDHLNIDYDRLILGGFSQGAIMSLNLALKISPLALVFMSGSFFPSTLLEFYKDKYFQNAPCFFQCHGKLDPLLFYDEALKVKDFLLDLGWKGSFTFFKGGHEVPHSSLLQIQQFLNIQISKKILEK